MLAAGNKLFVYATDSSKLISTCDVGYRILGLGVLQENHVVIGGWSSKISIVNIKTATITHTIDTGGKRVKCLIAKTLVDNHGWLLFCVDSEGDVKVYHITTQMLEQSTTEPQPTVIDIQPLAKDTVPGRVTAMCVAEPGAIKPLIKSALQKTLEDTPRVMAAMAEKEQQAAEEAAAAENFKGRGHRRGKRKVVDDKQKAALPPATFSVVPLEEAGKMAALTVGVPTGMEVDGHEAGKDNRDEEDDDDNVVAVASKKSKKQARRLKKKQERKRQQQERDEDEDMRPAEGLD